MPLELVLGRTGCGKTTYLAERIADYIDRTGERVTLIVPDQYTVASENFFLDRLDKDGKKRSRFLTVTSLKSLARTLFAEHGVPARFIGEGGKTVLMKKAADDASVFFKHYPPTYRNPRFLRLLLGAVKELKAAGISADDLMGVARSRNNDKLHDLALIRQAYEGYLSLGYFDPDDALERLCGVLEKYGDFEDEAVYVTNFRSFYNKERNVLLQLVRNGAHVTVTLPTDVDPERPGGDSSEALADAEGEARKLTALCRQAGEEVKVKNLQENASFSCTEFEWIEREFSRPGSGKYDKVPARVHLFRGNDRFDEAEQAAATIARRVREEGLHYNDFTVIVRSLEDYAGVLDPVFEQYEIPLFYHRKTPLRQRSPIPLVSALFSLATEGLNQEAMLAFTGSGFVAPPAAAAQFERYVKTWSIRYNRFRMPFLRPITGFAERVSPAEEEARAQAEEVRQKAVDLVEKFKEACAGGTVRSVSEALYGVLEELGVPAALDKHAEEYRQYGEYELAARQRKVYEQLILALDELVLTAGDDPVTLDEYRDLLFAVIDTHDVAILPTSLDEVTAGSPETLPMISPRFVFVLGLNDGVFPRTVDDDRLLNDDDREQLKEFGIGETTDDKVLHELYYLYASLTAPREELYLSYVSGEPSEAIRRIKELFPALEQETFSPDDPASADRRVQREKAAFDLYGRFPYRELADYFAEVPAYARVLSRREEESRLSPATAAALYPDNLNVSPSKADEYHRCRYAYFLHYGLNITPRRSADLNPAQRGTIIHAALEYCLSEGVDDLEEKAEERVETFGKNWLKTFFANEEPPAEFLRFFEALMKKVVRLLLLFAREFDATLFRPVAYEQAIGSGEGAIPAVKIPLERGTISLVGTVDRVDAYEQDGKKYLRVTDYKSGSKKFDFDLVAHGLEVQMLMYLYALQQNMYPGQDVRPAAAQYVRVHASPVAAEGNGKAEAAEDPFARKLLTERSGIYLKDARVLAALDSTEQNVYLNVKNPDSPFFITAARFGELFDQTARLLQQMGNCLHGGMADKNPVRLKSYKSCETCALLHYCRNPEARCIAEEDDGEEGGNGQ